MGEEREEEGEEREDGEEEEEQGERERTDPRGASPELTAPRRTRAGQEEARG